MLSEPPLPDQPQMNRGMQRLHAGAAQLPKIPLARRRQLIHRCIEGIGSVAKEWVAAACQAKQIQPESAASAEDLITGPLPTLRFLQLLDLTLADVERFGEPQLPDAPTLVDGQVRVPVFPTNWLYDRFLFRPMTGQTWLQPHVEPDQLFTNSLDRLLNGSGQGEVVVVLGAGNVSSIPATDALTKILIENCAVSLKMNPVNDYLGSIFATAFKSLIDADFLSIAYGGSDVGKYLVDHPLSTGVHITGSTASHNAIVWGSDPQEQQRRRRDNQPVMQKKITSELGNVSPWAIVPSRYSDRQLRAQAENVVASIVNNASFNCIATKLVITSRNWPQRQKFLDLVQHLLSRTPRRVAYYPGAADRFERFSGFQPDDPCRLPWTLLTDIDPSVTPHLVQEESFVGVCAEMAIDADSESDFLSTAVDFMNERVWGTLAATIIVGDAFQKRHPDALDRAIKQLRYGTIGINQWPALSFAWMSPPWGGYPSADLHDAESGIGFVHNTYLLDAPEKTVLRAPLTLMPKPIWYSSHRHPGAVAWSLLRVYESPKLIRMPALCWHSLTG